MTLEVPATLQEWAKNAGCEGLEWRELPREDLKVYKIAGQDAFRTKGATLKRVPASDDVQVYAARYEDAITYPVMYWFSPKQ